MTRIAIFARLTSFVALRRSFIGAIFLILIVTSVHAQTVTRRTTDGPTPSGLAPGVSAGSYALSGFDNINYATGSLNFALPLLTIGGRGTAQYTMMLPIERHWSIKSEGHYYSCGGSQICFSWDKSYPDSSLGDKVMPGYGPGVMQGRQTGISSTTCPNSSQGYSTTLTVLTFTTPDGSAIEFRDTANNGQPLPATPCGNITDQASRGTVFTSTDGSAMTFTSDLEIRDYWQYRTLAPTGYLMTRDGTRYRIVNGAVSWIRDRNGNQISFLYDTYGLHITDPLGRTVNISYRSASQAYDDISFTGFNGTIRHIRIGSDSTPWLRSDYQALTWPQAFPELNSSISQWPGGPEPSGPGYVEIPDGRRYRFYYNPYGELARVELPTTGAYEYDWASGFGSTGSGASAGSGSGVIYRRVITRRVYKNGGTGNTYTAKISIDRPFGSGFAAVKAYDAQNVLLAHTDHYYYGDPSYVSSAPITYPAWNDNREYKTDYFATNGTTLLRSVSYTWQPRVTYSWAAADPRLVETVTTLTDTNQVSKQTSINPQGGAIGFDQYNNQTDTWEYDYGQVLVRRTHTDYANAAHLINGLDYSTAAIHMRSLPTKQQVFDAGGILRAQASYEYDNYNQSSSDAFHYLLTPRPNISGLDSSFTTTYYKRGNVTRTTRDLLNTSGIVTASISSYAQYDSAGNVVKVIDPRSTPTSIIATSFDFTDRFGLPDGDARMNSGSVELGSQMSYAFPTKVTNPLGHIAYSQFDYYTGQPVDGEDANGNVASGYYNDLLDRPTQIRQAVGTSLASQTTFSYDDVSRTVMTTSDLSANNDNLLKNQTFYDGLGRSIESRQYESATTFITTKKTYDALGRASQASNPYRAGETVLWTTIAYDGLGRVLSLTTPDNAVVATSYSGNTVTVTDQAGKKRKSVTDGLGRLQEVYEDPTVLNYLTSYSYDALDNLITVTQGTQTRTFVYDSLKRLTYATNPESGTISYQYDNSGNLTVKTDARGVSAHVSAHYAYDALHRVVRRWYNGSSLPTDVANNYPALPPGVAASDEVKFYYDSTWLPNGAPTFDRGYATGRLVALTYGGGSAGTYRGYDALGRVIRQYQQTDAVNYLVEASYNLGNAMTSETYPNVPGYSDRRNVNMNYDDAGRLASLNTNGTSYAGGASLSQVTYAPHGAPASEVYGNNTNHKISYNSRLQTSEIKLDVGTTRSPPLLMDLSYNYGTTNNNGNVQSVTYYSNWPSYTQSFTYDSLNRLSNATETWGGSQSWSQTNGYDRYGNRWLDLGNGQQNLSFNPNNNRITTVGYGYDNAGNLLNDGAHGYTYDAENKIKTVDGTAAYVYDGEGQRVRKLVGENTRFVYSIGGQLLAEFNGWNGSLSKEYIYGPSGLVATIEPIAVNGNGTRYITSDHLGSPRVITNVGGQVVSRHDYKPFGEELVAGVGGRTTVNMYYSVNDGARQKFTSKERDNETGLDYFGARYYASTQGRFTSIDPENYQAMLDLTDPQSWNAYSYVNNNPLGRVDPDGKGFFSKLKNWLVWNVWGEEEDVKKEEQKRRDMMLDLQKKNGGELIIQNFGGEWVRVDPATMNRANVWLWSSQIYSSPGSRDLTAEEAANVLDVGAMKRLEYEASPKHGSTTRGNVSAAPKRGQNALDNSVQVKGTSTRRVGVDFQNREFVVFDETRAGKFHGHARSWQQLTQEMKNALVKSGMASRSGKIN